MIHLPSGDAAPSRRRSLSLRRFDFRLPAVALLFAILAGWANTSASAATHVVTSLDDAGAGTLRATIAAAAAGDVIEFEPSLFLGPVPKTIVLTSGELLITRSLTIVGPGDATAAGAPMLTISGNGTTRVLHVASFGTPTNVTISGLTIAHGRAFDGGGVLIENANLTLLRCDVVDNTATHHGGGVLATWNGSLTFDECVFARNVAADDGGGLALEGATMSGRRSLIDSNRAGDTGGGIYNIHGSFTLENCTITANTARNVAGIFVNGNGTTNCDGVLRACTVAFNDADTGTGGIQSYGWKTSVRLAGTIVAQNVLTPPGKSKSSSDLSRAYYGAFVSNNYNLIRHPGSSVITAAANDKIGSSQDPKLAALADNGGRTRTHALLAGSPALNWIPASFYSAGPTTDQRGDDFSRVAGATNIKADIGAFESQPPQVSVAPSELTAECQGAATPVELTFRVVDLDGDVTSLVVKNSAGVVQWNAGPVDIPPGPAGAEFSATLSVPHTGLDTLNYTIVASDAIYSGSASAAVTLVDTTPPVVTLNGPSTLTLECGLPFTDPGATAYDICDGALPVTVAPADFTPHALGIYTLTYSATDGAGLTGTATRIITVVDTTPPTITSIVPSSYYWEGTDPEICGFVADGTAFAPQVNVTDLCDPAPAVTFMLPLAGGGYEALVLPHQFPVGITTVHVFAEDMSGNKSGPSAIAIEVVDKAPPTLTLAGSTTVTLTLGDPFTDPGATANDNCDGPVPVTRLVNGSTTNAIDTCLLGSYELEYLAIDAAGNLASVTRTLNIVAPLVTITAADPTALLVDPGYCLAKRAPSDLATIAGLPPGCAIDIIVAIEPPNGGNLSVRGFDDVVDFLVGDSTVTLFVLAPTVTGGSAEIGSKTFVVSVSDPFKSCLANVAWPLAEELQLVDGAGVFRQMLTHPGESRWYKFFAGAGALVDVTITNLPANFDLIIYGDIQAAYDELAGLVEDGTPEQQALGLLGTEFAGERRSPEAYSPDAFARPEAYSPDAFAARKIYSPEAYSPDGYARPEAYSPDVFAAPEAYSPENLAARGINSPEAYSPDAYSAAQQRSMIAFSAAPGTISEGIRFNTYTTSGEFYIRIRGQQGVYSPEDPFDLTIVVSEGLCDPVTDTNTTPASTPAIAGTPTSLLVWDSARITGTPAEITALTTMLANFATAANGTVVDVAGDTRITALNAQADANPLCPLAKNLVADAIRNVIASVRAAHPSIADITLIGNDDVIPFFRTEDEANLGNELLYFPPVLNNTQSQSSLRYNQVLTQDRYGTTNQVVLVTGPFDLPEIPVARLVETAPEVTNYLNAYLPLFTGPTSTGGVLPVPQTAYVAAYDFMADSGAAIAAEFGAGLGAGKVVDTLIAAIDVPPAEGWTADDFRAGFLGTRHDLAHLAAHFSTSTALAADYVTRIRAAELEASPVDLRYALILNNGCHSGYNTVDEDAVPGITDQPDWAQAFSRKYALLVSGTGYQYGDTDFIDYTERLLLEYSQTLRQGTGPVPLGRALVDAKLAYLAKTPLMRGIHEKSLLQLTLYGLPMVKLNLPGRLPAVPTPPSEVLSTTALGGPGVAHELRAGDLVVNPVLTRVDQTFAVLDSPDDVVVSYYTGSDGFVPVSGEPIRPLETANVHRPLDGFVRGIGFRGGAYTDTGGFRPFTGAPGTELSTVHGKFVSPSFFPLQPWSLNQLGFLTQVDGYTVMHAFPAQFMSDVNDPESDTGTSRTFGQMRFSVFYCPEISTAALANAPALNFVKSTVDAGGVHVSVEAAATVIAGVQEVWVCFTGLPGSPYHGTWTSHTLSGPANATGIGTWTGTLPVTPGTDTGLLHYFVQAVNGFGAVSANTNAGRFFGAGASTQDGVGTLSAPTSLAVLGSPPSSANYGDLVPLLARLADENNVPLAGKAVTFKIGQATRTGITNASGLAAVNLRLNTPPGDYDFQATFGGDIVYRNATVKQPFTISKQASVLTLAPDSKGPDAGHILATLTAADGTVLKERAVIFLANNGTTTTAFAEITNGAGVARLAPDALPVGTYDVTVFYGQNVLLPNGNEVALVDPQYLASQDAGTFEIAPASLTLALAGENVQVNYSDSRTPGASSKNRGHSLTNIDGRLSLTDPGATHLDIATSPNARTVQAHVRATLSGDTLFEGDVQLVVFPFAKRYWLGTAIIGGRSATVRINWLPSGRCDNMSITFTTPPRSGPLYKDTPAVLTCDVTLGTGEGEHPAELSVSFGDATRPWTHESTNLRKRNVP